MCLQSSRGRGVDEGLLVLLLVLFHPQHHPVRVMFRILFFSFFGLHGFFHLELVRNIVPLLNCRAFVDRIQPALKGWEWLCLCGTKSASQKTQTLKQKRWERGISPQHQPTPPNSPTKSNKYPQYYTSLQQPTAPSPPSPDSPTDRSKLDKVASSPSGTASQHNRSSPARSDRSGWLRT